MVNVDTTQQNYTGRHNKIATLNIAIWMQLSECKICRAILIVIIVKCHYAKCNYAKFVMLSVIMQTIAMLIVIILNI